MPFVLASSDPTSHILPHDLFRIGPVIVTNQMLMALVAAVLMLIIFPLLFRRSTAEAPSGARNFFEAILEFMRVEVFRPALKEKTDQFVPFLWTLFFFILFCNLLGMIPFGPIFGLLGLIHSQQTAVYLSEWGGTATANINTTGALALSALLMIHFSGIAQVARDLMRGTYGHHATHDEHSSSGGPHHESAMDLEHARGEALPADLPQKADDLVNPTAHYDDDHHAHSQAHPAAGHGRPMNPLLAMVLSVPLYLWNFAPHPFRPQPGQSKLMWAADLPIFTLLLGLEMIGACIKPFALMIRLFANMIAGHLVLAVLVGFIVIAPGLLTQIGVGVPVTILSLLISILELFVAFLQAYIFVFLTTLFIASAVAPEH